MVRIPFTDQQIRRYSRQIILPEVGGRGQRALGAAAVLFCGLGQEVEAAAFYLAAAGVGRLTLLDESIVRPGDPGSWVAVEASHVGAPRVRAVCEVLGALNPEVAVEAKAMAMPERAPEVAELVAAHSLVVASGLEPVALWQLAEVCVRERRSLFWLSCRHGAGGLGIFPPAGQPCPFCAATTDEERVAVAKGSDTTPERRPGAGVDAEVMEDGLRIVVAGLLGTLAAVEASKAILGVGELRGSAATAAEGAGKAIAAPVQDGAHCGRRMAVASHPFGLRSQPLLGSAGCRLCGPLALLERARALRIGEDAWREVRAHACAAYPRECCGYLTGPLARDMATQACRCHNAEDAERAYALADDETLALARSLDTRSPAKVVYHSHVDTGAYFSVRDREMALAGGEAPAYPLAHLVIEVRQGQVGGACLYAWDGHEFAAVQWFGPCGSSGPSSSADFSSL